MLLHAGLAAFGHGVTARGLDFGGLIVAIASGDLHQGMARVRAIVGGHHPGIKVQVTQNATQPGR